MNAAAPIDPARHQQAIDIFNTLADLPQHDREQRLVERCGSDVLLLDEVRSLLTWDAPTSAGLLIPEAPREDHAPLPATIGPYRVIARLGAGGMANVYRAERSDPDRVVALKVLDQNAGPRFASLFRREVQLLARLTHPGIARLYDAGSWTSPAGDSLYLAMELIEGPTLTEYARQARPDRRARVELLIRLARAVAYAHQRGVIHRDLKPANILVDDVDGVPQPKILDFGIARAVESALIPGCEHTTVRQIIGTLAYMSPEQCLGDPDIDTRTDVYALGAVGFELLSGHLPVDIAGLQPSAAVHRLRTAAPRGLRDVDPGAPRDLAAVIGKALARDPDERYASAAALARDLQAFLERRPVAARPRSLTYAAGRFIQRNPALVAGGLAAVVLLAIGALGATWGLVQSRRANLELEQRLQASFETSRFLVQQVARELDLVLGAREVRRSVLTRLQDQIATLRDIRPNDSELLDLHATVLLQLSDLLQLEEPQRVRQLCAQALELRHRLADAEPWILERQADLSIALVRLGDSNCGLAQIDEGLDFYRQALEIDRKLVRLRPTERRFVDNLAWSFDRLAHHAMRSGRLAEAELLLRERESINQTLRRLAPKHPATLHGQVTVKCLMADIALRRGDLPLAIALLRQALTPARVLFERHPQNRLYLEARLLSLRNLSAALLMADRPLAAAPLLETAVSISQRLVDLDPSDSKTVNNHFHLLLRQVACAEMLGDDTTARRILERAAQIAAGPVLRATTGDGLQYARDSMGELTRERARAIAAREQHHPPPILPYWPGL